MPPLLSISFLPFKFKGFYFEEAFMMQIVQSVILEKQMCLSVCDVFVLFLHKLNQAICDNNPQLRKSTETFFCLVWGFFFLSPQIWISSSSSDFKKKKKKLKEAQNVSIFNTGNNRLT